MYLIVGAKGFLGSYLIKNILSMTKDEIIATDMALPEKEDNPRVKWVRCDVSNKDDIRELNGMCSGSENLRVFYLAAYHHPDQVLQNPRIAWNINITALSEFLNTMENIKVLYYPSTEVVYGQGRDGYRFKESDELHPANRYGEHKTVAERMVNVAGYNVVRFPVLMGPSLVKGKKHFYDEIVGTVQSGGSMEMFEDQKRTMRDFEALSKYELGLRIVRKHGLDESKIRPISMDADNKIFTAKRAKETLLDNSLVKKILHLETLKIRL